MMPLTTIGVTSWKISLGLAPVSGLPSCGRNLYDQDCVSLATFVELICVSGENRVPARSRLNIGQSASAFRPPGFCASPVMARTISNEPAAIRIKSTPWPVCLWTGGILSLQGLQNAQIIRESRLPKSVQAAVPPNGAAERTLSASPRTYSLHCVRSGLATRTGAIHES